MNEVQHGEQFVEYDIEVDFDKTKHLCDRAIRRRKAARSLGVEAATGDSGARLAQRLKEARLEKAAKNPSERSLSRADDRHKKKQKVRENISCSLTFCLNEYVNLNSFNVIVDFSG